MTVRTYSISAELTSNDFSVTQDAKAEAAFAIEELYNEYFSDPEKLYAFFNVTYEPGGKSILSQWDFWNIAFILGSNKITGAKDLAQSNAIKSLQRYGVDVNRLRELSDNYMREQEKLRLNIA